MSTDNETESRNERNCERTFLFKVNVLKLIVKELLNNVCHERSAFKSFTFI